MAWRLSMSSVRRARHAAVVALCCLQPRGGSGSKFAGPTSGRRGSFCAMPIFRLPRSSRFSMSCRNCSKTWRAKLGAPPPRETVHFFLFQAKGTYQSYMKQYFPRVPYRRALFIKARGPGMVFAYQGNDFEIDVRHECTHALLHTWLPHVPLWLDEGMAEYFEVPRDKRVRQNPHYARGCKRRFAGASCRGWKSSNRSTISTRWGAMNIATPGPGCISCCMARARPRKSSPAIWTSCIQAASPAGSASGCGGDCPI